MDTRFKREADYIGGKWVGADSGATIDVTDPATGKLVGRVPRAGRPETARAIDAAPVGAVEEAEARRRLRWLRHQSRNNSLMPVLERVCASTVFTMTAQ